MSQMPPITEMKGETELLLLPDGQILAHNITPAMAVVLAALNPADETMNKRAAKARKSKQTTREPTSSNEH